MENQEQQQPQKTITQLVKERLREVEQKNKRAIKVKREITATENKLAKLRAEAEQLEQEIRTIYARIKAD